MLFFRVFQHLLPNARAWRITASKQLREFFEGLTKPLGDDAKDYYDNVLRDLDPTVTRELDAWEKQFALPSTGLSEAARRVRLAAAWVPAEFQSPRTIQDALQAAGFDVFVHEWWVPSVEHPLGGSVDGDVTPVLRDPFDFLDDGSGGIPFTMFDGGDDSQDGDAESQDGGTDSPAGYPLVNKISVGTTKIIGDGSLEMQDGAPSAQDGGNLEAFALREYLIPNDVTKFPFFLYIGGQTFPENAAVQQSRRDEFEDLCLKICPTEQWLGILVTYS